MSTQDGQSTQSLPVDDSTSTSSSQAAHAADGAQGSGAVPSESAPAGQSSATGASDSSSTTAGAAAKAAKGAGKILGLSRHAFAGVVAAVAVVAAVTAGVVLTQQPALEDWFDPNASQGQFEGKSKEEIQAALNEEVKKGMMNISIAAVIKFPDGASEGEARIENIAANPVDQKVVIALKDSGEVVYESGALAPDQHIQNIKLTRDLDPGDYTAVATFTGYDRETHKQTGQAAAEFVIHVEG
ncbi:MAG TPA: flagellar protein FliS [Candidatus Gordonibacter avicola]|nr:flagellar protein FliS [Candidatus Gordonibacter avicola]